jgi:hypothetical protein
MSALSALFENTVILRNFLAKVLGDHGSMEEILEL